MEVAIVGRPGAADFEALVRETAERYLPSLVLAGGTTGDIPLLRGKLAQHGGATAYLCRSYACEEPVTDPRTFGVKLERAAGGLV